MLECEVILKGDIMILSQESVSSGSFLPWALKSLNEAALFSCELHCCKHDVPLSGPGYRNLQYSLAGRAGWCVTESLSFLFLLQL